LFGGELGIEIVGAPDFICANTLAGEVESAMDGASEGRGGMGDIPPFKA
jgi:hypothetical protein